MVQPNPTRPPGSGFNPPAKKPPTGGTSTSSAVSSQLITSTGGLIGSSSMLMTPAINTTTGKVIIITEDPTNFNCEEAAEYDFKQEVDYRSNGDGEGYNCTIHEIIVKYRELGVASCSINVTVYLRDLDDFKTVQIPLNIPQLPFSKMSKKRKQTFPDGKIHTIKLFPQGGTAIQGERPQVSITVGKSAGPISITKIILRGNADEQPPS